MSATELALVALTALLALTGFFIHHSSVIDKPHPNYFGMLESTLLHFEPSRTRRQVQEIH
jgi:hypothetical protein